MRLDEVLGALSLFEAAEQGSGSVGHMGPVVDSLVAAGWLDRVQGSGEGPREELAALKGELARVRQALAASPTDVALREMEAKARARILELSDALAGSEGAAAPADSPAHYRHTAAPGDTDVRYRLTYRGRLLLGDGRPRAVRLGALSAAEFQAHMEALRARLRERARRAEVIAWRVISKGPVGSAYKRAAAMSLAFRPEREELIGEAFRSAVAGAPKSLGGADDAEAVAAAEAVLLAAPTLEGFDPEPHLHGLSELTQKLREHARSEHAPDDALDAALLLWGLGHRSDASLAEAREFRRELVEKLAAGQPAWALPLAPAALLVAAGRTAGAAVAVQGWSAHVSRGPRASELACLLSLLGEPTAEHVNRWQSIRGELTRLTDHEGALTAAALLCLVEGDAEECVDTFRLALSAVGQHRLATSNVEAAALAAKLVLMTALRGHGREGDAEETIVVRPLPSGALLGLGEVRAGAFVPVVAEALVVGRWDAARAQAYDDLRREERFIEAARSSHSNWVYYG